ncbi:hypothetical protein JT24_00680 [Xylella fastidiosa]|nr:hypothetical protein JT24_00680 [Xylella fastidiosa]
MAKLDHHSHTQANLSTVTYNPCLHTITTKSRLYQPKAGITGARHIRISSTQIAGQNLYILSAWKLLTNRCSCCRDVTSTQHLYDGRTLHHILQLLNLSRQHLKQ